MPVLEITQAGINSITAFDPSGNSPTGNFGYCNAYNVDPTTFDKNLFKTFTTVAQQQAYLSSATTGARDGYATPPAFPYQGNANALARLGNVGTTVANQPAKKINKVTADQVKYLHQLAHGVGNFYFNLLVIYNTIAITEINKPTDKNMPIAFIYLFDGMQFKSEFNAIEMDTTIQYAGVAATIQYIINPVTTATFLEVALPDFLPSPITPATNVYYIKKTSVASGFRIPASISTNIIDYISGVQTNLWQFDTHNTYIETTVVSDANNTVYRTNIGNFSFAINPASTFGYFIQVIDGPYVGQCRRLTNVEESLSYITWETAFGGVLPTGTKLRIYVPNKGMFEKLKIADASDIDYNNSLRAKDNHLNGYDYFYDGMGSNTFKPWSPSSLNTVTVNDVTANYIVPSSKLGVPDGFSGQGVLSIYIDNAHPQARQVLRSISSSPESYTWERNVTIGAGTATPWKLSSTDILQIPNISSLPSYDPNGLQPVINKFLVSRTDASAFVEGSQDSNNNSIFVTKSSKAFPVTDGSYWTFSTHTHYICTGTVSSMGSDMGTYRDIVLNISSGATMANWNLDTSLGLNNDARFIIQFFDSTGTILPLYSGLARGIGVAGVTSGTNTVRVSGSLPTVTSGSVTDIHFTVFECNISYTEKIKKIANTVTYTFTDLGASGYMYVYPGGLIEKFGYVSAGHGTHSFTSLGHTNFPSECYGVILTPRSDADKAIGVTAHTASDFTTDTDNASSQPCFFRATGR